MEKFTTFTSRVIPLPMRDVDTDQIIPAKFLTSVSREGFGENLFYGLKRQDPEFVFNQQKYKGAEILAVDDNFGCGSSREHAVWAITGAGIRVVISKSFADIFASNSAKNGLLLVVLPPETVERILKEAESGEYELTVDLERQVVLLPGGEEAFFDYDPFRKHCLLNGLDDIDYILSKKEQIEAFRKRQEEHRFFNTLGAAS